MVEARFGQVAVLMGGWSSERNISLDSGRAVFNALQQAGVDATAIDIDRQTVARLVSEPYDRAFIAIHGRGGEDGTLQGMLDLLDKPYTGSGVLASALSMNKIYTKQLWMSYGLATPQFIVYQSSLTCDAIAARLGFPFAFKPVCEGSSIGVAKIEQTSDFEDAQAEAMRFSGGVFAESWISGDEYAVALLGDTMLPPIRLEPTRPFYDYRAKYDDSTTRYHCPCGLSDKEIEDLQALCQRACRVLGVAGWGRVDLIRDRQGKFWLLEVNTVPGMTSHSLVPIAAQAVGIDFEQLVIEILASIQEARQ